MENSPKFWGVPKGVPKKGFLKLAQPFLKVKKVPIPFGPEESLKGPREEFNPWASKSFPKRAPVKNLERRNGKLNPNGSKLGLNPRWNFPKKKVLYGWENRNPRWKVEPVKAPSWNPGTLDPLLSE